ncbi:MAG: carbohydrate ABC transporter permease [Bacteroidota bacterium]
MAAAVLRQYTHSKKRREFIGRTIVFLLLTIGAGVMLFPVAFMVSTSLKANTQLMVQPIVWIPKPIMWENYVKAWTSVPFTRYTVNTAIYAAVVATATVFVNAFAAHGFARFNFPGRNLLFGVLLGTMFIPGMVTMIPQYIMYSKLRWVGTYLPLVVPSFFASSFFVFMLRQFILTIPNELLEAARVDGARETYIWARIILPLCKPALATVAIMSFDGAWNDYLGPVLYLNNDQLYTLQVGLAMFRTSYDQQWQYIMAASFVVLLPVLAIFFVFQRYFLEGYTIGSLRA